MRLAQGAQLAFGIVVPLTQTVDADFWGTDTLANGLSTTTPSYWTGFYASNNVFGLPSLSIGNHYLVAEGAPVSLEQIVDIDIRPGKMPNTINLRSHGKIPVAILSSSTFDAPSQVDTASLTFGHTGNEASLAFCEGASKDVNDDGLPDLVCRFSIQAAGFLPGDTQGVLRGKTPAGVPIKGTDSVRVAHDWPEEADLESEAGSGPLTLAGNSKRLRRETKMSAPLRAGVSGTADLNGDGKPDLAMASFNGVSVILKISP